MMARVLELLMRSAQGHVQDALHVAMIEHGPQASDGALMMGPDPPPLVLPPDPGGAIHPAQAAVGAGAGVLQLTIRFLEVRDERRGVLV
jgi:hypothetical protein